ARDAQFVFLDADVADEHDGAAGVVGRVREQRRDVRRAPRRRLRANPHGRRDKDERPPTNPESQIPNPDHMTFFCAARYRMVPSATKSSAPLMYPLTPSCRNGSTVPTDCGPAMCPVPTRIAKRMPHSDPPAISPELNRAPAPISDSSRVPVLRSTSARTRPPAKIGAVDAIGRYEPTANDSERTPHSSSVTLMKTPTSTSPHGRLRLSRPLMMVAMSVACGAGMSFVPIPDTLCKYIVVNPMTAAEVTTPMIKPICW